MSELYKRYRPKSLKTIVGQAGAVSSLRMFIDNGNIPHAQLYKGPSGCGKTTAARVMKRALECGDADFLEINAADDKGIDIIRQIKKAAFLTPMAGEVRIFLLDECHKLTGDAQNALLKLLEDSPKRAYFILCTTDPQKVISTIRTRCTEIEFSSLTVVELEKLIQRVLRREEVAMGEEVIDAICEASEGSARKCLVILEQVIGIEEEADQLKAVQATRVDKEAAIKLCRAIFDKKPQWADVAAILKLLEEEDSEGLRYMVLGYSRSILLKGGRMAGKAAEVIDIFSEPTFNTKHAGLALYAWEAHKI